MTDHLDGNALAGTMSGLFAADLTTARVTCAGCGGAGMLGAARVYGAPMGFVARCEGCGDVLLRCAETPEARTYDLRGIAAMRVPSPPTD